MAGHASDPSVTSRIGAWQRAARGWQAVRTLKLARFGDNMRDVAVTEGDKVEAQLRFGVSVNTYGVNDLVAVVDAAATESIDALIQTTRTATSSRPNCGWAANGTNLFDTPRVSKPACASS